MFVQTVTDCPIRATAEQGWGEMEATVGQVCRGECSSDEFLCIGQTGGKFQNKNEGEKGGCKWFSQSQWLMEKLYFH